MSPGEGPSRGYSAPGARRGPSSQHGHTRGPCDRDKDGAAGCRGGRGGGSAGVCRGYLSWARAVATGVLANTLHDRLVKGCLTRACCLFLRASAQHSQLPRLFLRLPGAGSPSRPRGPALPPPSLRPATLSRRGFGLPEGGARPRTRPRPGVPRTSQTFPIGIPPGHLMMGNHLLIRMKESQG